MKAMERAYTCLLYTSGRVAGQFDTEGTTQEMILEASLKQEDGRESES